MRMRPSLEVQIAARVDQHGPLVREPLCSLVPREPSGRGFDLDAVLTAIAARIGPGGRCQRFGPGGLFGLGGPGGVRGSDSTWPAR